MVNPIRTYVDWGWLDSGSLTCKSHGSHIHTAGSDGNMMVMFINPLDFPSYFHSSHHISHHISHDIFHRIPMIFSMIYSHDIFHIFPWYFHISHHIPWKIRHLWMLRKLPGTFRSETIRLKRQALEARRCAEFRMVPSVKGARDGGRRCWKGEKNGENLEMVTLW